MPSPFRDLDRPPLDAATLGRDLSRHGALWRSLRVVPSAPSTNGLVGDAARAGEPEGLVVIAEEQTAGRGRLGREWVSPPRAGITLSVLFRPPRGSTGLGWIPLLGGLATRDTVDSVARVPAVLKWPNDVLAARSGAKLAGVLAERVADAVVLGMGLNISTHNDELPHPAASSLLLEGAVVTDRATLVKGLLRALAGRYLAWRDAPAGQVDPDLVRDYRAACRTIGQAVRLTLPGGGAVTGEAVGVDGDGRLLLRDPAGPAADPVAYASGDVVHLRAGG